MFNRLLTDGSSHLLCPVCGFDYVLISGIKSCKPSQNLTQTQYGISISDEKCPDDGNVRGNIIELSFECESGCKGSIKLQFHKGHTEVSLNEDNHFGSGVIWRN